MLCETHLKFVVFFFFFNDTATTEIYTLSLHDALPISGTGQVRGHIGYPWTEEMVAVARKHENVYIDTSARSEEHTSELQSHHDLVCRLLLEKKKTYAPYHEYPVIVIA